MDRVTHYRLQDGARWWRASGPGAKLTLLILVEHMGLTEGEWVCNPSQERIAHQGQQSSRTVRNQLAEFERVGLITVRRVVLDGRRETNVYALNVEMLIAGNTEPEEGSSSDNADSGGRVRHIPEEPRLPPEELEKSHKRTSPPPPVHVTPPAPTSKTDEYTPDFEEFWTVYPKKIEKKAAFAKWKATIKRWTDKGRTRADVVAGMLRAAGHYASACSDREPRFIMAGARFVGPNEPWLDWTHGDPDNRHRPPRRTGFDSLPESLRS